ncbi:MAG: hypothetical protein WDZ51_18050 [Pirellulaceae bacterium]
MAAIGSPLEYAKSLEAIATWQLGHASNLLATPFLGERKMNLLDRVRRVLGTDSPAEARKARPLGLAILATPLLLWAFSLGMLPGQRTEVVAEPVPLAAGQPRQPSGQPLARGFMVGTVPAQQPPLVQHGRGVNSDAGVKNGITIDDEVMGRMSMVPATDGTPGIVVTHDRGNGYPMQTMRVSQIELVRAPRPSPNQSQHSAEPESSDLSPRDRAMLQMMTELRYEVMALRYEIRQMRQPESGPQPQYQPPGAQQGGYGAMQSPFPQQSQSRSQFGTPPPTTYHAQPRPEIMPPRDKPEEGDKPEKKDKVYTPRSQRTLPGSSKPQEGNRAEEPAHRSWGTRVPGPNQPFNGPSAAQDFYESPILTPFQAPEVVPSTSQPEKKDKPALIPGADERYSRRPPEGILADPKKETVKAPERAARQVEPPVSNAPGYENPWAEAVEGMVETFTPSFAPPATSDRADLESRLKETAEAKAKAEAMRMESEMALKAAEEKRRLSERNFQQMERHLRETHAMEVKIRAAAEEARHQAKLAEDRGKKELDKVREQLIKAALRIKELEDQAAAKAAESTPTETPSPSGEPITPQPNPVD